MVNTHASPVDLHAHSTASDGVLAPGAVVERAAASGVRVLALTDHDTLAGLAQARAAAGRVGLLLVPGIELSVTWHGVTLHVLGLGIDPDDAALGAATQRLERVREARASAIAERLQAAGIGGALEGARRLADRAQITRTHFARFLVEHGAVATMDQAFKRYLGRGTRAYVNADWAGLDEAVLWIRGAGGSAVLAHPLAYRLSSTRMRRLLQAFVALGGAGIEVVCGGYSPSMQQTCARWAREHGLLGSVGSDFHTPETPWCDLGRLAPLPPSVAPVWAPFVPAGGLV